jgi:DNA repair exonuclease SbcCD ATPase subunit
MQKRLNILEKKMNNILNTLTDYEIKIKMEKNLIKFYKISKLINKTIKIDNYEETEKELDKDLNVKYLCGYERIIFNLSIRLALNNMNIMSRNNFIVIDEGFSAADSVNIHKFSIILETIKKEYDICLLISHIDEIKNQNGNIIKINYNKNTLDSNINII